MQINLTIMLKLNTPKRENDFLEDRIDGIPEIDDHNVLDVNPVSGRNYHVGKISLFSEGRS